MIVTKLYYVEGYSGKIIAWTRMFYYCLIIEIHKVAESLP